MTRFFDMSRIRWILAGAVALLALFATGQSLGVYLAHDLTVGVLSVIALAVTMLVGLGSLASARRRIGAELAALRARVAPADPSPPAEPASIIIAPEVSGEAPASAEPERSPAQHRLPASALLEARRQRLLAIREAGVRPDRQVLAEATAAEEAGRAYIGRYFVATTVLIGLVGTFAGLMATLSKVGPLLGDREAGGLSLLAGPLAGLHVTFGASLVAILATLALALAQGDLALHEEQALAALEDHTTHQLIPELWPPSEDPAERTIRVFAELKLLVAEAVSQSLEKSALRVANTTRSEVERAARALESTAATVERQMNELGATVGRTLQSVASNVEQAMSAAASSMEKQFTQLGTSVGGALESSAGTVERQMAGLGTAFTAALEASASRVDQQMTAHIGAVGILLEGGAATVGKQLTDLAGTLTAALETSAGNVERQFTTLSTTVAGALESAAAGVETQMTRLSTSVGGALEAATLRQDAALAEATRGAVTQAAGSAEEAVRRSIAIAEESVRATTAELERTLKPMMEADAQRVELMREAFGKTLSGIEQSSARLAQLHETLEGSSRNHVTAIENAGQAVLAAFDRAVVGAGTALDAAAGKLATAAHDMGAGAEALSPRIAALATELGALGREVALQAARGPEGDLGAVVLGELDRIGAGLDRLIQLNRLAAGAGEGEGYDAPAAAELGASPDAESTGGDVTEETPS